MSLQGTGDATKYWAGASPSWTDANKPFCIGLWVLLPSNPPTYATLMDIADGSASVGVGFNASTSSAFGCYDYSTGAGSTGMGPSGAASASWQFLVGIFDNTTGGGRGDAFYLNNTAVATGQPTISPNVFSNFQIAGDYRILYPVPTNSYLGEATLWSGILSTTDIAKLWNGGAGGKGVNPKNLVSSGSPVPASLVRYYLPVGGANDFADHSGQGGATLAAQGGATPTWNASDPPVNLAATATPNPPLIVWMS